MFVPIMMTEGAMDAVPQTEASSGTGTARTTEPPLRLLRRAVGGPRELAGKARRLAETLRLYANPREIPDRLRRLQEHGLIDGRPSRLQLIFGGLDMLRFMIEPAARDYYRQRGISFGFHQLLRVLDDPVSMIDPTGFLSARDTIIGHLMQVVHLDPIYDLQMLQMFGDGLDQLEAQLQAMIDGNHPRRASIGAIVEDPAYHARLLDYVRRYRRDPDTPRMARAEQTIRADPHFAAAERTFATLPGFIDYCSRLPDRFGPLLRRFRRLDRFPLDRDA
jgi:hypothetical protein